MAHQFARLGIGGMDASHLILWKIMRLVEKDIRRGDTYSVIDNVELLITTTRQHFENETKLMSSYTYPDFSAHEREHFDYVELLYKFREMCGKMKTPSNLAEEFKKIKLEFVKHIDTLDAEAATFLKKTP